MRGARKPGRHWGTVRHSGHRVPTWEELSATWAEPARKRLPKRQDFELERLSTNLKLAREALARSRGLMGPTGRYRDPGPLTGILDQDAAIEARLWFERVSMRAARRHERRLRRAGVRYQSLFLTVILPSGAVAPHRLKETDLAKLRKAMQRYARALPADSFFAGMLEVDYLIDQCAGVEHWQWHGHFIVVVPCRGLRAARKLVRKAFPVRRDPARGVYRPVRIRQIRSSLGGLQGVVEYAGKALQLHGVHRKVVTPNAKTGRRGKAQKQHLTPEQLALWVEFAAGITADSLTVWSGYRRYGDRLVKTSGHGGGGRRRPAKS
jgi:hypothetical protein